MPHGATSPPRAARQNERCTQRQGGIMLKIWGRVNSVNVQKVMWAVAELGIPHERINAGMQFGVVTTPEYRKMNPNGRVPTIEDGGFVLWESNTIVRYLYAKYGPQRTPESQADSG